jgi:hypothetical protein
VNKGPPYRLAVLPFSLSRGRDFNYYTYSANFMDNILRVINETQLFVPVYSVYELKNKYGTRLLTEAQIPKETRDKIWAKSGIHSPELDVDLAIRLGKQLSVDAILVCKLRSDPYSLRSASWNEDFRLEKLEVILLDVNSKAKYSTDNTDLAKALKQVFGEFKKGHRIADD